MGPRHPRSNPLAALVVVLVVVARPATAAYQIVSATLEPAAITVGHSALLTITTLGTGTESMLLPFVGGLEFRIVSQSHRVETIKGAMLTTTTLVVRVTPQMAGTFSIPDVAPKADSLMLQVDPDHLLVRSSSSVLGNASRLPPFVARSLAENGIHLVADGAAFVRVSVPKRQAYVGESIPIEIEVGLRSGFVNSVNGLPTLVGGDFTLNNLSRQPERSERSIAGKPFGLFTWHSVIAAVKPGSFAFSVEVPLTVKFSTRPKADSQIDDLLGDPFLQNHFGSSVTKDVKVSSSPSELAVVALPMENRPADFSGAVGTFTTSSDVSPATAAAGDPLSLRLHVIGSGNFDRVDTTMLRSLDRWKTYPPRSSFNATDTLGYHGEKIFEQPVIASDPGVQILPGLAFSFFDPTTGRYETARSAPLTVTISKSLADMMLAAPVPGAAAGAAPTRGPAGGLRPDHAVSGTFASSLMPLYLRPPFLAGSSLMALALGAAYLGLRRRAPLWHAVNARRDRRRSRAIAHVLVQLEAAASSGDSLQFFGAARSALQPVLLVRWHLAPDQITAHEIGVRLGSDGDDVRQLFELADEVIYSGLEPTAADYSRWTRIVVRQMMGGDAS
jgi:hypothetical protein